MSIVCLPFLRGDILSVTLIVVILLFNVSIIENLAIFVLTCVTVFYGLY